MKPTKNNLIVKLLKYSKTSADIALTEDDSDKDLIAGEIIESLDSNWKKGQKVVFGKYSIATFTYEGEEYSFLPIEDIIGII